MARKPHLAGKPAYATYAMRRDEYQHMAERARTWLAKPGISEDGRRLQEQNLAWALDALAALDAKRRRLGKKWSNVIGNSRF